MNVTKYERLTRDREVAAMSSRPCAGHARSRVLAVCVQFLQTFCPIWAGHSWQDCAVLWGSKCSCGKRRAATAVQSWRRAWGEAAPPAERAGIRGPCRPPSPALQRRKAMSPRPSRLALCTRGPACAIRNRAPPVGPFSGPETRRQKTATHYTSRTSACVRISCAPCFDACPKLVLGGSVVESNPCMCTTPTSTG